MNPMRILVVDDETIICQGCSMILSDMGHSVETRSTCGEGIEAILGNRYDLVLLDLKLPDRDGFELLKTVNGKQTRHVVVMSGYATVQNAVNSMKLGAVDFLPKPFTEDELVAVVENIAQKDSYLV